MSGIFDSNARCRVFGLLAFVTFWMGVTLGAAGAQMIEIEYGGEVLKTDLSDEARGLKRAEYETSTVWTEGVARYEGVLLKELLAHLEIDITAPGAVTLVALDGYSARLNFSDITPEAPLLAFLRDGAPMSRREQGPYWLIFPYDQDARYRTETVYALSVWQISRLIIHD